MDNRGNSYVLAVVTVTGTLVVMTVLVMALGTVIDAFLNIFPANFGGSTLSPEMMGLWQTSMRFFDMFFWLPLIFVILIFVWLFKTIIWRHIYTREEEEWSR